VIDSLDFIAVASFAAAKELERSLKRIAMIAADYSPGEAV